MSSLSVKKIRYWLFVSLIVLAPLSKYPSFGLPSFDFPSFRFGFYQLLATVFVFMCLVPGLKKINELTKQNAWALYSLLALATISVIGLFTSLYFSRSLLLVVSILFLLCLVGSAWWYCRYELPKSKYKNILKYILVGGVVYGLLAVLQLIISTFTSETLGILCKGCSSAIFGFPRINLFTAEPQFFANSMLIFFFVSLGVAYGAKSKLAVFSLFLSAMAITLTFSRGALIALIIGLLAFILLILVNNKFVLKRTVLLFGVLSLSSIVGFGLLVGSASYKYKSTPYITYNTVVSSIDHLTLGLINIPEKSVPTTSSTASNNNFVSPGLIESSGDERLGAAELAIKSWRYNSLTLTFGVGGGNLGPFTIKHIQQSSPDNLTVYIYYVLVLAELGIIGFLSLLILISASLVQLYKKSKDSIFYIALFSLGLSFSVQYLFFGTYINAVYIWLFWGIVLGLTGHRLNKKAV
jgi:hypothetical protein